MDYELEEGQIVLCTVEKIVGTTVFVKIDNNGEGTITTSEISPGRIRNLRDYVIPGKKIVCKVLSIRDKKIHLSLRRVKQYEKKELLDKLSKENSYKSILKTVLQKEYEPIINKINENFSIVDFFEKLSEMPKLIYDYTNKTNGDKILKILESKKDKPKELRQNFKLSNNSSSGIKIVKNILQESCKEINCDISYIAAGTYRIEIKGKDFKEIKTNMNNIINFIEKTAKKQNCEFALVK